MYFLKSGPFEKQCSKCFGLFINCLYAHFFLYFQEYKSFSLIMGVLKLLQQTFCTCLPSTREAFFWLLPLCFPFWNAVLVELPITVPHPSSTPIPWRRAGQRIQMMSVILSLEFEAWSRVTQGLKIVEADSSQWWSLSTTSCYLIPCLRLDSVLSKICWSAAA